MRTCSSSCLFSLNVKKSNVLLFRPKNESKKNQTHIDLKIDGVAIEEKESAKYLGLYFDNKMTFREHVNHIVTKLKKGNGILVKLRYFVPKDVIRSVYFAHIESHLNYGSLTWGTTAKYNIDKITSLQKKAIKIINFVKVREHIDQPFKTNNILPFDRLRALAMTKFIWKTANNLIDCKHLLEQNQITESERDNQKYLIPYRNTLIAKNSVFYSGIIEWNKVPDNIKSSTSLQSFNKSCKEHMVGKL